MNESVPFELNVLRNECFGSFTDDDAIRRIFGYSEASCFSSSACFSGIVNFHGRLPVLRSAPIT
jgi:hypothetical protein